MHFREYKKQSKQFNRQSQNIILFKLYAIILLLKTQGIQKWLEKDYLLLIERYKQTAPFLNFLSNDLNICFVFKNMAKLLQTVKNVFIKDSRMNKPNFYLCFTITWLIIITLAKKFWSNWSMIKNYNKKKENNPR